MEPIGGHRAGEQEPLRVVAAELLEPLVLCGPFDPLGDAAEVEHAGQADDRGRESALPIVAVNAVDEPLVDLEDVDRQLEDVAQRRVPGAEVVDRDPDAELAQRA